ncbi:MBL fold metallo-hydrolase [Rhodococcoides kyotonense]|uniref:MBL fold metallo-hydrolase n=1 Tax=Rhodococcoides kyotonense TaxID=398843 RepID=UPI000B795F20|nr:MBL fold metallo-hydrolase [Rhodococcus kyotonensis]
MSSKSIVPIALGVAAAAWLTRAAWGLPTQLGAGTAKIAPYAANSSRYRDRRFHNTEPSSSFTGGSDESILTSFRKRRALGKPQRPVPIAPTIAPADAGETAVTWYGHSSVLIELDGRRILADPVWSNRVSPSRTLGPARLHPTPLPLRALPAVDAIVISHDHYDHLDKATIQQLASLQDAPFVVPIGIGAHLRRWRVPESRIVELDWDEQTEIAGLTVTCTEARHFSGRGLKRDLTQWASWAFAGPQHRVFFGGDTGYTAKFTEIGEKYGPFDLTLLPVGAYDPRWADIHMNPEEAVRAHLDLRGNVFVPVHWATFNLAFHPWSEPIVRLKAAAEEVGVTTAVPMPGQRIDVAHGVADDRWWARLG